ncbi:O-antigen ligase [Micrococcus sp. HMSC067E09]|uniref:O-antigen ligase family protein n=1 Tax=Micrococcus sp. HMSC067E09 TaxID=1739367 RepID=UPI0009F1BE1C|nr:O-antigen ligase family protein [Micrococcus sp. HMSC067E09]
MTSVPVDPQRRGAPRAKRSLSEHLVWLAMATLPFQRALTIDVGVPLKLSEIFLGLVLVSLPFTIRRRQRIVGLPAVVGLAMVVVLSTLVAYAGPLPLQPIGVTDLRFDTVFYGVFAVVTLVFWWAVATRSVSVVESGLRMGVWLCLAAVVVQFVLYTNGQVDLLEAMNFQTDRATQALEGDGETASLRTGPFTEGQHLGFFAGGMFFLSLRRREWFTALAALGSVYYSQSTTSFIAVLAGVALIGLRSWSAPGLLRTVIVGGGTAIAVLSSDSARAFVRFQGAKLGLVDMPGGALTRSMDLRAAKTEMGFQMALDHPLVGLGPGRFAGHFADYVDRSAVTFPNNYFTGEFRPIVENAYAQIGAELGLVALVLFICLLVAVGWNVRRSPVMSALALFLAVMLSTASSWTFMPAWAFLAVLCLRRGQRFVASAPVA